MRGRRRLMRQTDLVERVLAYDPDADEALLNKAYVYAMTAHGKQFRASGDPYFAHPLEVAAILTDLKLDVPTIVTALLHDTIEDTLVTYDDIKEKFGEEIANLVDGVTKLSQLEVFSERTKQAENFRKLMLAITSDIRVLLVKLADRLHNMRTLGYIDKPEKRRRIAQETVDIYAPLAGRIGMQNMREELEDLAFAELDPEARNSIVTHFARLDMVGGDRVGRIADQIKRRLAEHGHGGLGLWPGQAALFDLAQAADQEAVLRAAVRHFRLPRHRRLARRLLPGAGHHPYQLADGAGALQGFHLHAQAQRLSQHPHHRDRAGKAAGGNPDPHPGHARHRRARRRRPLALSRACARSSRQEQRQRHLWLAARHGGPAGARRQRRRGAGAFAPGHVPGPGFLLHAQGLADLPAARAPRRSISPMRCIPIWATARSAPRSTATMSPCTRRSSNGDQVEIITTKDSAPSPMWEQFVVTGRARAEIRRFLRHAQRDEHVRFGRKILEKTFADEGRELTDKAMEEVAKKLRLAKAEDVYADVGRGALRGHEVLQAVFPELKRAGKVAKKARARRGQADFHSRPDRGHFLHPGPMLPPAAGRPHRGHQHPGRGARDPHHRLRRTGQGA